MPLFEKTQEFRQVMLILTYLFKNGLNQRCCANGTVETKVTYLGCGTQGYISDDAATSANDTQLLSSTISSIVQQRHVG